MKANVTGDFVTFELVGDKWEFLNGAIYERSFELN